MRFTPTLIVRSKGTDTTTANLIDVTSWTYTTVDGIVIPRSISVSKFDERTGAPTMQRNLYLKSAIVNERLDKSTFDTDEAHSTSLRNPATDSDRRSSGRRFDRSAVREDYRN